MLRTPSPPTTSPAVPRIPPLQNGDRLSRAEFERRFDATPHLTKAELIEGVVYMAPPISSHHSGPHFDVIGLLFQYRANTPGVDGGDNGSLRLDLDNMPQPDAYLRISERCGGQSRIDKDGYVDGAPELIVEIAATSASYDLHDKLRVYRRNQVREYVVWRVFDEVIDYFVLHAGNYEPLATPSDAIYRSRILPGCWLDAPALLRGDLAAATATMQQGLASPEHAQFVAHLAHRPAGA